MAHEMEYIRTENLIILTTIPVSFKCWFITRYLLSTNGGCCSNIESPRRFLRKDSCLSRLKNILVISFVVEFIRSSSRVVNIYIAMIDTHIRPCLELSVCFTLKSFLPWIGVVVAPGWANDCGVYIIYIKKN